MNSKNNRSVRRTRTALARSFIELAKEKPIKQITIGELTECADISRSTFYTHFHDVYELMDFIGHNLIDCAEKRFQETMALSQSNPDNPADSPILDDICSYIHEEADAFRVLLGDHGDVAFCKNLENVIRTNVLASMESLYGHISDEHAEDFSVFMSAGCIGLVKAWLAEPEPEDPHVMAKRLDLFIKGGAQQISSR